MTWHQFELGDWLITLAPELGGRVARLAYLGTDILVPLQEVAFDPEHWPKAGAYPLVPFHNRIPNAHFTWRDREAFLPAHPDTAPHALHGHGARRVWSITEGGSENCIQMQFESAATKVWPWSFSSRQTFSAVGDRLTVTLEMTNCDSVAIPAGLGWHPYFPAGTQIVDDATVGWQVGADYFPEGQCRPRRELTGATVYLGDWTEAKIVLKSGLNLRMIREVGLAHLVRFAPEGADFACLEPVSHRVAAMCEGPLGSMDEIEVDDSLAACFSLCAQ